MPSPCGCLPKDPHVGMVGKMAANLGADAQGNPTDHSRSQQHRHRRRRAGDDDFAVRVRNVARCDSGLRRRHRPGPILGQCSTHLVLDRKVDGVLQIPSDFSRRWHDGAAEIQILVDGTDANQARIMQGYAEGPVALWSAAQPGSTPNPALPATRRRLAAGRPGPTSINDHWGVCAVDDVDVDTQGGVIKLGRCRRCGRALCVFT
jgi:hypothetical protein